MGEIYGAEKSLARRLFRLTDGKLTVKVLRGEVQARLGRKISYLTACYIIRGIKKTNLDTLPKTENERKIRPIQLELESRVDRQSYKIQSIDFLGLFGCFDGYSLVSLDGDESGVYITVERQIPVG